METKGTTPVCDISISADGRYVSFASRASNLVSEDTNGYLDVFVHDRKTGETTRVSVDMEGNETNDDSSSPSISADGRYVAFRSSTDLRTSVHALCMTARQVRPLE